MSLVTMDWVEGRFVKVTLNDPDTLNAMSEAMAHDFVKVTNEIADAKNSPRAIILTGAGRAFSAGGDLDMLEKKTLLTPDLNKKKMKEFYGSFLDIRKLQIPLVAAINGHAIGAGLCVASACDIRIAAAGAKLGFTFAKLGLHPGMGATYFLPRVVGASRASELLLTGRVIDTEAALKYGLISEITKEGESVARALEVANEISTCGPECIRQLVESLRSEPKSLDGALDREAECQGVNYASIEFKEGIKAAKEKRVPTFAGSKKV